MAVYNYNYLKETARKVKEILAEKGFVLEKRCRKKPRDREKLEIIYEMALNKVRKFRPYKKGEKIVLPYFSEEAAIYE